MHEGPHYHKLKFFEKKPLLYKLSAQKPPTKLCNLFLKKILDNLWKNITTQTFPRSQGNFFGMAIKAKMANTASISQFHFYISKTAIRCA